MTVFAMCRGEVKAFPSRLHALDWLACEMWQHIPEKYLPVFGQMTFEGKECYVFLTKRHWTESVRD